MTMHESSQAREAYDRYLSLGPQRSTAKVAHALGKSKTLIDRWCGAHGWVERIAAHERTLAAEREAEEAERRRQAREARLGIAANVMSESYKQFMANTWAARTARLARGGCLAKQERSVA